MKKLGFLNSGSAAGFTGYVAAFRQGLKETGNVEGPNLKVTEAWADGDYKKLPKLAKEFVNDDVHVIAATGGMVTAREVIDATKKKKKKISIVYVVGNAPTKVKAKGGNATGVNLFVTDYIPGLLSRLRLLVPKAEKVALLVNPRGNFGKADMKKGKAAKLILHQASTINQIKKAIADAAKKAQALIVSADPYFTSQRDLIIDLTARRKLPTAYAWRAYSDAGGLMSCGPDLNKAYRQAGVYAGRLLNNDPLSSLPSIDVPAEEFKLVINETTATALDLPIPGGLRREAEIVR